MGAAGSVNKLHSTTATSIEEEADELYPYFILKGCVVEPADTRRAKAAWTKVTEDESPEFLRQREAGLDPHFPSSCLNWFYDSFYHISREMDPSSQAIYGPGLKAQVKALVGMITMTLNIYSGSEIDMEKATTSFQGLAKAHCHHVGVRAFQYPKVAEILLLTFARCLGPDGWDEDTKTSWMKLLSATLVIIVPAALREEATLTPEQIAAHEARVLEGEQTMRSIQEATKRQEAAHAAATTTVSPTATSTTTSTANDTASVEPSA